MSILVVEKLAKTFGGVHALAGVSFSVAAGEILALIGPNGAGKTTCFNLVNGQLAPDSGSIEFEGSSLVGKPPREICHRGIGRTFQVTATFGSMTAQENVHLAMLSHERRLNSLFASFDGASSDETKKILAQVGMQAQADRPCAELAYGDLKRVELAVALAARPRLLLMDEPTSGMASAERLQLMGLVKTISRASGVSVLFTEHDMDVVFAYADRVIVLSDGALIAQGAPAEVRANPEVRRVYLGEETAHA